MVETVKKSQYALNKYKVSMNNPKAMKTLKIKN